MFYLRLFKTFYVTMLKRFMTFRGSLVVQFFSQGLNYAATFLLMHVMISAFGNLNGWTSYEVLLLYALSLLSYGFAGMFFYFFHIITSKDILDGNFDDVLLKPICIVPYCIFKTITPSYFIHIFLSVVVLVICIIKLEIAISAFVIVWLLVTMVCGILIFGGMFMFITAPVFVMTHTDALFKMVFFFRESGYYPVSIFPKLIQMIMVFILPYSMMNFFPVQLILNKSDYLGLGAVMPWLAPVFSIAFFSVGVFCFVLLSKKYKSTGA